ncbi:hypothetical protein EJ03DRAFT_329368 [Teratosphaeria nubilosa]|uniref:USP domain-containing protein n=1 Tax=Teratosphaeria nubilosa TaxID=161662 RepID=A0A6G1L2W5_9PEZI|nr:hypothetical protein EJ03DRAFT_329368 [Teratosphaeria nubilosa]
MAPTNSPPRDEATDADPDASRKRARLSNEPQSLESVRIEALAPEDFGSDLNNAIHIEDDDMRSELNMDQHMPLHLSFRQHCNDSGCQIADGAGFLDSLSKSFKNTYLAPSQFKCIADWLAVQDFTSGSMLDFDAELPMATHNDADDVFLGCFATFATKIMCQDQIFAPDSADLPGVRRCVFHFAINLMPLTMRVIKDLPDFIKYKLAQPARKDSKQEPRKLQNVEIHSLNFVRLLSSLLILDTRNARHLHVDLDLSLKDLRRNFERLLRNDAESDEKEQGTTSCMASMVSIFGALAAHETEIKDAWRHMSFTLSAINACPAGNNPHQDNHSALALVDLVNNLVLNRISEKHPRALPRDFHLNVVSTCSEVIKHTVGFYDGSTYGTNFGACFEVYKRVIQGGDDYLLPDDSVDPESLANLCEGQDGVASFLLRAAWVLKAYRSYVFSSIMDIRSIGMTQLSQELGEYLEKKPPVRGPLLSYAGRFLQAQDITRYIFSADSHASIVGASDDIIGFLAQAGKYTNKETDVIWRSCTASVEADFAKASFGILQHVCEFMDYDQLLYVLGHVKLTPIATLAANTAAADTLAVVLRYLEGASSPEMDQARRLQPLAYCLDLLYAIYDHGRTAAHQPLYHVVFTQVTRYVETFQFDDKIRMIADCLASIRAREPSQDVTAGVEVVAFIITESQLSAEESSSILDLISPTAQIAQYAEFVQNVKSGKDLGIANIQLALIARVRLIVGLLALQSPFDSHQEIEDILFAHLLGPDALDNTARDVAWTEIQTLCHKPNLATVACRLMKYFMEEQVPHLPAEFVTPGLIEQMVREGLRTSPEVRVRDKVLKTLVRVASTGQDQQASGAAAQAVSNLLFAFRQGKDDPTVLAQCQRDWTLQFIDSMCSACPGERLGDDMVVSRVIRSLTLLNHIYHVSKQLSPHAKQIPCRNILVENAVLGPDRLDILAQYARLGASTMGPQKVNLVASAGTTLDKMAAALEQCTGAAHNRIIVAGKLWDPETNGQYTLDELGLSKAASVIVSPRYTFSSNVGAVFECVNPVEQALAERYDSLEQYMLQGPSSIQVSFYNFLTAMKPSMQARSRVTNPSATAADLFPSDRLGETIYSIFVLCRHLEDHARLGVVDTDFVLRSTRLIVALFMDSSRNMDFCLVGNIAEAMCKFLQEKPSSELPLRYFEDPTGFSARMANIITNALQGACSPDSVQASLAAVQKLYGALTDAFRADAAVWTSFTEHTLVGPLHAQILLDGGAVVSSAVADAIKLFCSDGKAPANASERYWQILSEVALGPALQKPSCAGECFNLATEVLSRNASLRADEPGIRALVDRVLSKIWKYQHTEAPNLPLSDKGLTGLLRMLQCAVTMLKAFKKPLLLDELPIRLFDYFLFPDPDDQLPLIHSESRGLVIEVIKTGCESAADFQDITQRVVRAISSDDTNPKMAFPGTESFLRDPKTCTGLTNLGMTCYMNSLVQQLYANLAFRKFIFDVPVVNLTRQIILKQVKDLFLAMQEGTQIAVNTIPLCQVLSINTSSMEDVHDFYTTFLNKLEESMPDEASKKTFGKFYTGRMHEQIKGSCGHVSGPTTPFTEIAATVKNKASLEASMSEFVQGEPMMGSNQYRCSTCSAPDGRLVDAMKRTCLIDVPDNLTFCLKRGDWDPMLGYQSKINDRFEFPELLDMSKYTQEYLEHGEGSVEPDMFELVGVIVHLGSLQAGHYWSYVRLGGTQHWMQVEDARAHLVDGGFDSIQDECFGSRMPNGYFKTTNGYVVFYRRQNAVRDESLLILRPNSSSSEASSYPPKVAVPTDLAQPVARENNWRYKVANLYSDQMGRFLEWLIDVFPICDAGLDGARSARSSDAGSESRAMSDIEPSNKGGDAVMADSPLDSRAPTKYAMDSPATSEHLASLAALCSKYLMHLVMRDDKSHQRKLDAACQCIYAAISRHGAVLARLILDDMVEDGQYLPLMWTSHNALHRAAIANVIERLLFVIREDAAAHYAFLQRIMHKHITQDPNEEYYPVDYWRFASRIACLGSDAVLLLLDLGYLERVSNTIVTAHRPVETTGMVDLIYHILSEHVNLFDESELSPPDGPRHVLDGAICLRETEWEILTRRTPRQGRELWCLGHRALLTSLPLPMHQWQLWAPGRLVGLLASKNACALFADIIADSLAYWYDNDEDHLLGMLAMTLHYCRSQADSGNLSILLQRLGTNLKMWNPYWVDSLTFFDYMVPIAHEAAVDSTVEWTLEFLIRGSKSVRRKTKAWLETHMYTEPQPAAAVTSACVAATRKMAMDALPWLRQLRNSGNSKSHCTEVLESMAMAGQWLVDLRDTVRALTSAERATLDKRLQIELDESRATPNTIRLMQEEAEGWPGDIVLPTIDAQETVEVSDEFEDDDEFSDEQDYDDAD